MFNVDIGVVHDAVIDVNGETVIGDRKGGFTLVKDSLEQLIVFGNDIILKQPYFRCNVVKK
jgi:hypothetical protein